MQKSIVKESVRSARRSVLAAYAATAIVVTALVGERLVFQHVFADAA